MHLFGRSRVKWNSTVNTSAVDRVHKKMLAWNADWQSLQITVCRGSTRIFDHEDGKNMPWACRHLRNSLLIITKVFPTGYIRLLSFGYPKTLDRPFAKRRLDEASPSLVFLTPCGSLTCGISRRLYPMWLPAAPSAVVASGPMGNKRSLPISALSESRCTSRNTAEWHVSKFHSLGIVQFWCSPTSFTATTTPTSNFYGSWFRIASHFCGEREILFIVHIWTHLVQFANHFGTLDTLVAFPFECDKAYGHDKKYCWCSRYFPRNER